MCYTYYLIFLIAIVSHLEMENSIDVINSGYFSQCLEGNHVFVRLR